MKNNLRQKRTWRLALSYLAVIMLISVSFSGVIFAIFSSNLRRGGRPQPPEFSQNYRREFEDFATSFEKQIEQRDRDTQFRVVIALAGVNFAIFLVGIWVSFLLAKWTLKPIEENIELQSQFVSDASHEIRTPLAAMLVSNEIALRKKNLTEEKSREVFRKNIDEIQNLADLAESLLNLSNSYKSVVKSDEFNTSEVVDRVFKKLSSKAESRKIKLKSVKNNIEIKSNFAAVEQILTIFTENAIKYSPEKSTVKIEIRKTRKNVFFEVCDSGDGISKDDQKRIFERFYRVDSARTRQTEKSHGLGLAIAKNVAERNGFEILVESEPKKGSKFILKV